jgi:hypothetical protein
MVNEIQGLELYLEGITNTFVDTIMQGIPRKESTYRMIRRDIKKVIENTNDPSIWDIKTGMLESVYQTVEMAKEYIKENSQ